MSYAQYSSENSNAASIGGGSNYNQPQNNKKSNIIIAILVIALIGTWAYIIYNKSKVNEERIVYIDKIQKDSLDRSALQAQFNMLSNKADSITSNNFQLQGALAERASEINRLKNNIATILKNKNATAAELAEAQKQIIELNNKIEELYAEVETLTAQNKQLTASNEQLNDEKKKISEEKDSLQSDLDKTKDEKAKAIDIASTLHAYNINVTAIHQKGSKEKETIKAKRADYFKISFDIAENHVAQSGTKALLVCIYYPDGSLSLSSGTFTDRQGNEKQYTNKVSINYVQGNKIPVSFEWKPGDKFKAGEYKIEIYNNGYKIGETFKTIK
ncbi:MAG: hypothetical protein KF781_03310 [Chitinophagaceae bacterium]|nr:hypothetical protein [Chitinophagaceae bacterium]MCW5904541.1 hypothetical protein [Chitinophagaceae bacterium]